MAVKKNGIDPILFAIFCNFSLATACAAHEEIEACTKIESSLERLSCFDDHFKDIEKVDAIGNWVVSTEVSPIDDTMNVFMSLKSDEPIRGRFSGSGPMVLNLMCRENTTDLSIYFNGLHMSDHQYGTVTYRLDKTKARQIRMVESTSNKHLGLWGGDRSIPFIKGMLGHSRLLIEATPYGENSVLATFNISGVEESISSLRKACNW